METITDHVNGGIARQEGTKHEQKVVSAPMSLCGYSLIKRGDTATAASDRSRCPTRYTEQCLTSEWSHRRESNADSSVISILGPRHASFSYLFRSGRLGRPLATNPACQFQYRDDTDCPPVF